MERLSEPEFEHRLLGIAPEEFYGAVVIPHDLAGQREPDAGAFLLRGEERDEDLLLVRIRFSVRLNLFMSWKRKLSSPSSSASII